jgi:hypothetical protein
MRLLGLTLPITEQPVPFCAWTLIGKTQQLPPWRFLPIWASSKNSAPLKVTSPCFFYNTVPENQENNHFPDFSLAFLKSWQYLTYI